MKKGLLIGDQDEFEDLYTDKFRTLANSHGIFIKYEKDRAAIDIGIHLKQATRSNFKRLTSTRVWVQLKGIRRSTITPEEYVHTEDVALDLKIEHLRFWYASPEAVYLVVYIECADIFLAEDIRDIVDRQWGESIFYNDTFQPKQKKARIRVRTTAMLDDDIWSRMINHRALRIDGPTFRGRPLGHRLDPLRCIPDKMEPSVYSDVVNRLLYVHNFQVTETLDETLLFPNIGTSSDVASLAVGRMYYTYEWVPQLLNEFGYDPNDDFRIEGEIIYVQGHCAVLIHSNPVSYPNPEVLKNFAKQLVETQNITRLLVFVNSDDQAYFGSFFGGVRGTDLECMPQLLGDLAFNLLTATTVYLEFREKITWRITNYLY